LMIGMSKKTMEHSFSIELNSRGYIRTVSISDIGEKALIEGALGNLLEIVFRDDVLLEVLAENGALLLDVSRDVLEKAFLKVEKKEGE